jgi:heptosyltransferase-2
VSLPHYDLKTDCRHFRGDIPCRPHKEHGVHCVDERGVDCPHYDRIRKRILIIKLGALGDVIRTTPLLTKLREVYPGSHITWLTASPEVLPPPVDEPLLYTLPSVVQLRSRPFDLLVNLDKDRDACALAAQISATEKKGFTLKDGVIVPANSESQHKYLTGIFNDVSQLNRKSYPQEIFEICGFEFNGEKYLLNPPARPAKPWKLNNKKKVIGLNTGCGGRWTSRLWADARWVALAKVLKKKGYEVVLLGGEQEHIKNLALARKSKAKYFGHFPLDQFLSLVDACDLVVTGVTMAMHFAIGLGKRIVLFNNIFNKHEFELYGLGEVLEPSKPCRCFYRPTCINPDYRCMEHLAVGDVVDACVRQLPR